MGVYGNYFNLSSLNENDIEEINEGYKLSLEEQIKLKDMLIESLCEDSDEFINEGLLFASKEGKEIKNKINEICKSSRSGIGEGFKRAFSKSGAYDQNKLNKVTKEISKLFDTFSCSMMIIETVDNVTTYFNSIVGIKGDLICSFRLISNQRGQFVGSWTDRKCEKVYMEKDLVSKIIETCNGSYFSISKMKVSVAQFTTSNNRQILNEYYNKLSSYCSSKYPDIEVRLNDNLLQNSISFRKK